MSAPEKLNLWDRFFNRYSKELIGIRNERRWEGAYYDVYVSEYHNEGYYWLKYGIFKKTDRLTGSTTIVEERI